MEDKEFHAVWFRYGTEVKEKPSRARQFRRDFDASVSWVLDEAPESTRERGRQSGKMTMGQCELRSPTRYHLGITGSMQLCIIILTGRTWTLKIIRTVEGKEGLEGIGETW